MEFKIRGLLITLLVALACSIIAENTENNLLKKRAHQLRSRRQFEKAISIHETVLKNDPNDVENVFQLILILLQTSKIEKAESLLHEYNEQMLDLQSFQLELMIMLHKAEFTEAKLLSNQFLNKRKGSVNNYRIVARIFEQYRQYDIAVEIFLRARKITGDNNLFIRELANDYYAAENYKNSIIEFIKLVKHRNQYATFVVNRFKEMLKEDRKIIKYIKDAAAESNNIDIKEIYALCLGEIEEFDKALEVYETLPAKKILKFADRMENNGNEDIAINAYDIYLSRNSDVAQNATIKIRLSQIYLKQNNVDRAENILLEIYHDNDLKSKRNRYKTKANKQSRELLAQISLMRNAPQNEVMRYLKEAKTYSYNRNDNIEVEFKIIHLLILNEKNNLAKEKLKLLLNNESSNRNTFNKGYYYSFLIAVMTNDPKSDSLLSELLVNNPEDDMTNDALRLFQILSYLQNKEDRKVLLAAYRKRYLYRFDDSLELLSSIYDSTKIEKILFLLGEWSAQFGKLAKSVEIFSHNYEDPDLQQYAKLKLTEIERESFRKKNISSSFLRDHPQSVFSPQFRRIMSDQ